ncbi:MAG: hypothetical protein HC837_18860 [Chloroflexaceae bacterium]|nr:hypothetical protein [Chloroflexaceae bacterium]
MQPFTLGQGTNHHALIVGKTGSGKSTLLHILITTIALYYHPEEVELYLIDFKKGVEFKLYATYQLPHARVIAIESEREFGLSVLEGLYAEYERRGDTFRHRGVNSLKAYRQATGERLPRILLLVDEFHKFFIEQDPLATRAYQVLELLVREGRSAGIHILLASQTLTGSAKLPDSIKEQIGIRVALQCSEADSRLILADDNTAARLLSRPGEAIYNSANGLIEGNNTFQVAWLNEEQQKTYLTSLYQHAQQQGFSARQIVFEGNQPATVEQNTALQQALTAPTVPNRAPRLKAWLGEPTAIRDSTSVTFQARSANNVLIIGNDERAALGMLVTALVSLAAQLPATPRSGPQTFSIIDLSDPDSHTVNPFAILAERLPHPIAVARQRRQRSGLINAIAQEVAQRMQNNTAAAPLFLILYGLQKARDLRLDAVGPDNGNTPWLSASSSGASEAQSLGLSNSFGSQFGMAASPATPATTNPAQQLPKILRDGPEFGVYTLIWCDTSTNLNRTFERATQNECMLRIVFQMSEDDSVRLIGSTAANKLGDHRALFYDDEKGSLEKFRPYGPPNQQWLEWALAQLTKRAHTEP